MACLVVRPGCPLAVPDVCSFGNAAADVKTALFRADFTLSRAGTETVHCSDIAYYACDAIYVVVPTLRALGVVDRPGQRARI